MADGTLKVGTITTSSGSGTITLGQSGETVDMANGSITLNSDMKSTPAFSAYINAASFQFAENSWTKLQMYGEDFDTDGAYSTSTYRFTPQTAGKYFVYASLSLYAGDDSAYEYGFIYVQKNTTDIAVAGDDLRNGNAGRWFTPSTSTIVDMNGSSDYLEVDGIIGTSNSPLFYGDNHFSTFGAYKIIE